MLDVHIEPGLPPIHRQAAALLYDEAFGAKLSVAIPDAATRIELIRDALDPTFAFVAIRGKRLVGLAGIHTAEGSLTDGLDSMGFRGLVRRLGLRQAVRAAFVLGLIERPTREGQLLMDGIAVSRTARGQGIGSLLLQTVADYARSEGYRAVRLDVIDTNERARALYERRGFVATDTQTFPLLRGMIGFESTTTMILDLTPQG